MNHRCVGDSLNVIVCELQLKLQDCTNTVFEVDGISKLYREQILHLFFEGQTHKMENISRALSKKYHLFPNSVNHRCDTNTFA